MENNLNQIKTYKKRQAIKLKNSRLKFETKQKKYLKIYFSKHQNSILALLALVFLQIMLEISLLIWGKVYLNQIVILLKRDILSTAFISLIVVIFTYVIVSYITLKKARTILVNLINNLRENWFKNFLSKTTKATEKIKSTRLLTKITYHFSLIQMGFIQVVTNTIYLVISLLIILALIPTFASSMLPIFIIAVISYSILIIFGYYIANKFISREQTLSSAIISHVSESILNIDFIKKYDTDQKEINHLNKIVILDSYFRIRRSTWMALGKKILFVIFILIFSIIQVIKIYYPEIIPSTETENIVLTGIVSLVLIRLAYTSLSIGLYLPPLRIGLILSTPEDNVKINKKINKDIKIFKIYSSKTKLKKDGDYYAKINFKLINGDRISIKVKDKKEEFNLTNILSGNGEKNGITWNIKLNKKRKAYKDWVKENTLPYYIDPYIKHAGNIGEIVIGKNKREINEEDIEKLFKITYKHNELKFITTYDKKLGTKLYEHLFTKKEVALLQMAHCLINKPHIIIIDSYWNRINDNDIKNMIKKIEKELKESIIISFDSTQESGLKYSKKYTLTNGKINEEK